MPNSYKECVPYFFPLHFMMGHKSPIAAVVCVLVVVGALNWGLVGLGWLAGGGADWNVVKLLLGKWTQVEAVVYILVGLAGVYKLVMCAKGCCGGGCCKDGCDCGHDHGHDHGTPGPV